MLAVVSYPHRLDLRQRTTMPLCSNFIKNWQFCLNPRELIGDKFWLQWGGGESTKLGGVMKIIAVLMANDEYDHALGHRRICHADFVYIRRSNGLYDEWTASLRPMNASWGRMILSVVDSSNLFDNNLKRPNFKRYLTRVLYLFSAEVYDTLLCLFHKCNNSFSLILCTS